MFKKLVIILILGMCLTFNVYAQSTQEQSAQQEKDSLESIKKYLTPEENDYFIQAEKRIKDFMDNNKDLEKYLASAVQSMLKGDKKGIEIMFSKVKTGIEGLIKQLSTLNVPASLKKYHQLNIDALQLLVKKLEPATLTNQDVQKKLDTQGEMIVRQTNQEIENLIKSRS